MIAAIWAQSPEGIIGIDGKIPWHYKGDLQRFKRLTLGSTIVMGRKTWESIGSKPLPGRVNMVVSRRAGNGCAYDFQGVPTYGWGDSVENAIARGAAGVDTWIIGGAEVYAAAMPLVDVLDVTYVPRSAVAHLKFGFSYSSAERHHHTMAPVIDETVFRAGDLLPHEDEPTLTRRIFVRRTLSEDPYELADNRRLQEQGVLTRRPR